MSTMMYENRSPLILNLTNLTDQAGDMAWMLTSTALVLLMIPGVGYAVDCKAHLADYSTDMNSDSSTQGLPEGSRLFR